MSFLDESATLQDALAFLDAYDGLDFGDTSASAGDESSSMDMPSSPEPEPKRKTRAKPTAAPKMRHRDRVKAELIRLRHEAETLETTLLKLKAHPQVRGDQHIVARRRSPNPTIAMSSSDTTLMELAVGEYRSRRRSEITNRKLKSLLVKQLKIVKASEGFFHTKIAEDDLAVLYESQRAMEMPNNMVEDAYIRDSLSTRVHQLKLDVDKHVAESGLAFEENFMFRSQRKMDKTLGPVYETVSNTPLQRTMEHTNSVFWNGFMVNLVNGESSQHSVPGEDFTSARVTLVQFGPEVYERKTRATLLKEVHADRIIYIWSSWTPFPSKKMNCVEDLMITVRRASTPVPPSPTKPSSLLQIWYRVHASQNAPIPSANHSALDPHKESMLRSQSGRIGGFIQTVEAALLDESHNEDVRCMPALCQLSSKEP